ncbi:MAG: hypothetical protein JW745_03995 [Sedimentisphaerales bacterium]|nr:hypothetical protein [Sedimentisphaerales bacterium]MBN2842477.1 hypothetical protein [Sedimentisphaerales bacterium]
MLNRKKTCVLMALAATVLSLTQTAYPEALLSTNGNNGSVVINSDDKSLSLTLANENGCYIKSLIVAGQELLNAQNGVSTTIKVAGNQYSSASVTCTPELSTQDDTVSITGIKYGPAEFQVEESWVFTVEADTIAWTIERSIPNSIELDDSGLAQWVFADMETWTGGILDSGAVAWNKLLAESNSTLGSHAGEVLFWNKDRELCLNIKPTELSDQQIACRFTHNADNSYTLAHTLSDNPMATRVDLIRFIRDSQVWKPFTAKKGVQKVTYQITAPDYAKQFDLGEFKGVDESAVREILNTILRYGTIDRNLCGGNGWRTGYICLHEQWFAQMAMAIHDNNYTNNVSMTYDHFRDNAVKADGRILARFKDNRGDDMPGTYTSEGFYEAQWGYLLDSQPDYVIVVAEQFHNTGDLAWVSGQRATCRAALEYMLKRDSDGDGLLEMMTNLHTDARGSDWIDIIWASYENALVNAEMYQAMTLWSQVEEILGDTSVADKYRLAAAKLKASFNKDIADGGFWNPEKQWFVYWRDKDDSIHGNNLVIPVNFAAIGYDLCTDEEKVAAITDQLEAEMVKEKLFSWPLCVYPYEPGEGAGSNYPFPTYENGDIFLSWAELGTRIYARRNPELALKYINNIIGQYQKDGLAFQRYARFSQQGLGDDILGGNGMAIVGLYRNIFGIQPQYNRLYLEPHLSESMNGTIVKYQLRDTDYEICLTNAQYSVAANGFAAKSDESFGINISDKQLDYYIGKSDMPFLSLEKDKNCNVTLGNLTNQSTFIQWTLKSDKPVVVDNTKHGLTPKKEYIIKVSSGANQKITADGKGNLKFSLPLKSKEKVEITLLPDMN